MEDAAQRPLGALVERATKRSAAALDVGVLAEIKAACRASDDAVRETFEAVLDRLRQPHSQVRSAPRRRSRSRRRPRTVQPPRPAASRHRSASSRSSSARS